MKYLFIVLVFICLLNVSIRASIVMPWMGLERTQENITSDLEQILENAAILSAVSFERFNLGPNSTLIVNNLTDVQYPIQNAGLLTLPMISTYPWGRPQVLEYARELYQNPQPFIDSAIQHIIDEGFDGYNVDIEPVNGTESDAIAYAQFIDLFAQELHKYNKILTVDAATYTEFWNFTLLGQTSVDYIFTMSTYSGTLDGFTTALEYAVAHIPLDKLAVGMMTVDDNGNPFTTLELDQRFQLLLSSGIQSIGIWDSPLYPNWIPFLKTFYSNNNKANI